MTVYPGPTRTASTRRDSLDNSREARRMSPEALAAAVVRVVQRRERAIVSGVGNRLFAVIWRWFPALGEWDMKKTLWEKLRA